MSLGRSPSRAAAVLLATVVGLSLAPPALADHPIPDDARGESVATTPQAGSTAGSPAPTDVPDVSVPAPTDVPDVSIPTARLGGATRYDTAVSISKKAFPAGAGTVYLARSDIFADAIAAGSLTDGPVLLVPSCGNLPAAVRGEIARVDPTEVVALGGNVSICEPLLQSAGVGRGTDRLAGADRFETAAQIAARAFPDGSDTVYLAEHQESADAVAGGSLTDGPVLLVANGSARVPSATSAAIAELDPAHVVALGGTGVVTQAALTTAASGRHTDRVSGKNRYATSAAIAARAFPDGSPETYLANGVSIADAVVGGTLTKGPILLVQADCRVLAQPVWRRIATTPPEVIVAVCTDQLRTGARLAVFSGMETGDTARLYDLLTKPRAVSPLRYVPADLVDWRSTSHRLRPEASVMLEELFDAAAAAGKPGLYVTSAYRSYETQQATYAYWVELLGEERASMISAKAGHSEHQLGLAVDVGGPSCSGYACFGDTPEGKWVAANAHKYGFIIRYPQGGTHVTGYDYEPWHLRYVGPRAAWMMHVRDRIYWDTYQPIAVGDAAL